MSVYIFVLLLTRLSSFRKFNVRVLLKKKGNFTAERHMNEIWGPWAWRLLHELCGMMDDVSDPATQQKMVTLLENFSLLLPCPICSDHYEQLILYKPPRPAYYAWSVEIHNAVNSKLGKNPFVNPPRTGSLFPNKENVCALLAITDRLRKANRSNKWLKLAMSSSLKQTEFGSMISQIQNDPSRESTLHKCLVEALQTSPLGASFVPAVISAQELKKNPSTVCSSGWIIVLVVGLVLGMFLLWWLFVRKSRGGPGVRVG
jgi:hypothetical protein